MWLKRLTLVNWANLPNQTYEFEQVTLITGPTGAGKTTLLDAVQALMTAAMKGLYSFNPGQDETSQHSRTKTPRTLASYALGCDDGQYARPSGSNSYVIGYFEPGEQEDGVPFSAMLGIQATLAQEGSARTPREDDSILMVVHDLQLGIDDVVRGGAEERHVVPLDTLLSHLRLRHAGQRFEPAVNKQEYIAQLYGAFSGHRGLLRVEQAKRAARQFTQFMVYRKIERLDDFVRNDILEGEDMREHVGQVSRLMRDVQRMRDDAARILEGVERLKRAEYACGQIIDGLSSKVLRIYEQRARALQELAIERGDLEEQHAQIVLDRDRHTAARGRAKQEQDRLDQRINRLRSEIAGSSSYQQRETLKARLESHRDELARKGTELLTMNDQRHRNRERLEMLLQLLEPPDPWAPSVDVDWAKHFRKAVRGDGWRDLQVGDMIKRGDFDALLNQEAAAKHIDRQYNAAIDALRAHREEIGRARYQAVEEAERVRQQRRDLDRDIEHREASGEVTYRPWTQAALELIKAELPGANPRVICDHVEVVDERWQMAIEGMFGDQRFDIVVDEAYEADAIRLLNDVRRRTGRRVAAVVQGSRAKQALRQRDRRPGDTVVGLMTFTDDTVAAFVQAAFARKRQVESNEALTREASGLTIDGNSSGGFRMRVVRIDESDLVFGQNARALALQRMKERSAELAQRIEVFDRTAQLRQRWYDAVNDAQPLSLGSTVEDLVLAEMGVIDAEQALADLDISDIESVTREIESLEQARGETIQAFEAAQQAVSDAEAQGRVLLRELDKINARIEPAAAARDAARQDIEQYREIAPKLAWDEALGRIEQQLDSPNTAMPEENQQRQANYYGRLSEAVTEFNTSAYQGMQVRGEGAFDHTRATEEHFRAMALLGEEIAVKLSTLADNILARNREELEQANERFQQTFITDVCLKMNSLINDGRRSLQQLNERLRHHYFGNEYYQFEWRWRSDMKPYADFFSRMAAVRPESQHGDLFERPDLSEQDREIFRGLQQLLLAQDARMAERELERLTDYRQYRSYDILKLFTDPDREPISLKSYGTGSGGQTENPSYVIRSAALSSALRWSEGNTHLRFVIIDESFSKLDEQRSKECIDFLADVLGLQVVFVVTDKSSGPMHDAVDLKIDVSKLPAPTPIGELKTRVMVQPSKMKRRAVRELFERDRIMARSRASQRLAFLEQSDERPET